MFEGFQSFSDAVGLLGVLIYIGSYFVLQLGWIRGQGYAYPAMNIAAASCVLYSLTTNFNLASATIQVTFIAISIVGMTRFYLSRAGLRLNAEERAFIDAKFTGLEPHLVRKLLAAGRWRDLAAGEVLTTEGESCDALIYLARGQADVMVDGRALYRCPERSLLGEITVLTDTPATATCLMADEGRACFVDAPTLRRLVARDGELRAALEAGFSRDVRSKMVHNNAAVRQMVTLAEESRGGGGAT